MAARTIDTTTTDLLARVEDGVAVITMNRPDRRNAFSNEMLAAMGKVLVEVEAADDVHCVVMTGAAGAFSAGGDVKSFAEGASQEGEFEAGVRSQRASQRATTGALWAMSKPTIAALPGATAGGGLGLALACDLRVAAEGTVISTAFAKVGFPGDWGVTWLLTHLVGPSKAKELLYFADRIDAAEAHRIGLVNRVWPAASFEQQWSELASRLAAGPPIALGYMKENVNRVAGGGLGLEEFMDVEVVYHRRCGLTEDHLEASRAFVAKRDPVFRGR